MELTTSGGLQNDQVVTPNEWGKCDVDMTYFHYNPQETWQNRYKYCKFKTTLEGLYFRFSSFFGGSNHLYDK